MRIFLTGANGFIGRHLVPILKPHQLFLIEKEDVHFQNSDMSCLKVDLSDVSQWGNNLKDFSPEACIHLAWSDLPDYSFDKCMENFNMTMRLYEFLKKVGCKRIFTAGTCWEYGNLQGKVGEGDTPPGMNLFASFKSALRLAGESLTAERGIDFIWGRIFFVYGPGQREQSLIPYCYKTLKRQEVPVINNPHAINDFIYVSDVANAIAALIETPATSGVFNIGTGAPTTVGQLCNQVAHALGVEELSVTRSNESDKSGFWADTSKIYARTGWRPQISLQKGIEKTVEQLGEKHGHS